MGLVVPNAAKAVTYDISWTGSNGYSLTGSFSFDDSLTGIIRDYAVDTFMIEGFHNGESLGTWNLTDGTDGPHPFNFNFDVAKAEFIIGGLSDSNRGQAWNRRATGLGFESGNNHQVITLNGIALDENWDPVNNSQISVYSSTLIATLAVPTGGSAVVPVPGALILFASGMVGLLGTASRRHRT